MSAEVAGGIIGRLWGPQHGGKVTMSTDERNGFHELLQRDDAVESGSDRSFGLVFAGVFGLIGLAKLWHDSVLGWWWLGAASMVLTIALTVPGILAPGNRVWLKFGLLLHHVVEPVVMGLLFFLTVMPIGLGMRVCSKDLLRLKWDCNAASYWILRTPPGPLPDSIRQQF